MELASRVAMAKKSNGTELAERFERIRRLTDELERVQGERRRIDEIAEHLRQEAEAVRCAVQPMSAKKPPTAELVDRSDN